jgi:8-oxo-dGTP diphosphatase
MGLEDYDGLLADRLRGWRPDYIGTLVFLLSDGRVLLMRKKRGHGAGRINGPGGKIEAGETPLECAIRETIEETGVRVLDAELAARLKFVDLNAPQWFGHIFVARRFEGRPRETAEGDPAWYPVNDLPFDEMWEDDRIWLPRLLAGEKLEGDFLFDDGRLLAHRLRSLSADELTRTDGQP